MMFGTFNSANDEAWRRCPPASAEVALHDIRAALPDAAKNEIKSLLADYARFVDELKRYSQEGLNKSCEREKTALADSRLSPEKTASAVLAERKFRETAPIFEQKTRLQLADARHQLFPACIKILESLVAAIDKELSTAPDLGETMTRWGLSVHEELVRAIEHPLLRLRSMAQWDLDEIYKPGRSGDNNYVEGSFTPENLLGNL